MGYDPIRNPAPGRRACSGCRGYGCAKCDGWGDEAIPDPTPVVRVECQTCAGRGGHCPRCDGWGDETMHLSQAKRLGVRILTEGYDDPVVRVDCTVCRNSGRHCYRCDGYGDETMRRSEALARGLAIHGDEPQRSWERHAPPPGAVPPRQTPVAPATPPPPTTLRIVCRGCHNATERRSCSACGASGEERVSVDEAAASGARVLGAAERAPAFIDVEAAPQGAETLSSMLSRRRG